MSAFTALSRLLDMDAEGRRAAEATVSVVMGERWSGKGDPRVGYLLRPDQPLVEYTYEDLVAMVRMLATERDRAIEEAEDMRHQRDAAQGREGAESMFDDLTFAAQELGKAATKQLESASRLDEALSTLDGAVTQLASAMGIERTPTLDSRLLVADQMSIVRTATGAIGEMRRKL